MGFKKFLKILSLVFFILGCVFLVLQAIDDKNYDKEVAAVVTYVESHKSDDGRYTYNAHCKYKVGNKECSSSDPYRDEYLIETAEEYMMFLWSTTA